MTIKFSLSKSISYSFLLISSRFFGLLTKTYIPIANLNLLRFTSKQAILAFSTLSGIYSATLDILKTKPGKNLLSNIDFPWAFIIPILLTEIYSLWVLTAKMALTQISLKILLSQETNLELRQVLANWIKNSLSFGVTSKERFSLI